MGGTSPKGEGGKTCAGYFNKKYLMRRQIEEIITSFEKKKEIYLEGLFLSARWFVVSGAAQEGLNVVILPNSEAAEYASSDLYALTEGDVVFFLPS